MNPYTVDRWGRVWMRDPSAPGGWVFLAHASALLAELLSPARARELADASRARAAEHKTAMTLERDARALAWERRVEWERSG